MANQRHEPEGRKKMDGCEHTRALKDGRKLTLYIEEYLDQYYFAAAIDGREITSVSGIGKAPAHKFGAEFTHIIGPVLLKEAEAEALEAERARLLAAREAKRQLPEGLEDCRAALEAEEDYRQAFSQMMEDGDNDGARPPRKPTIFDFAKYPRAMLYLRAEGYTYAANDKKYSAGKKALKILEAGGSMAEAQAVLDNWV